MNMVLFLELKVGMEGGGDIFYLISFCIVTAIAV